MTNIIKGYIAGAALIVLPFVFQADKIDSWRVPKIKALCILATIIGAIYVARKIKTSFGVGAGLLTFSSIYSGMGIAQIFTMVASSAGVVTAFIVNRPTDKQLRIILWSLSVSGLLCALLGYTQMFWEHPLINWYQPGVDKTIPTGNLGQETLYGPFIGACLIASLYLGRWHSYLIALIILFPLVATKSSFAIGSTFAAACFWVWHITDWRAFLGCVLLAFGIMLGVYAKNPNNEFFNERGRMKTYTHQLDLISKKPFWGYGHGTFKYIYPSVQPKDHRSMHGAYRQSHNDYLQIMFAMGAVGLFCMIWLFYDFGAALYRKWHVPEVNAFGAIFILFSLDALGSFPFRLTPQGVLALWSWVIVTTYKEERSWLTRLKNCLPLMRLLKRLATITETRLLPLLRGLNGISTEPSSGSTLSAPGHSSTTSKHSLRSPTQGFTQSAGHSQR